MRALDLRPAPRDARPGLHRPNRITGRHGPNAGLVQGGGLAEILTPNDPGDRSFWLVDKIILAYFAFSVVLIVGWWSGIPGAPLLLFWHLAGAALLIFEVKRPNRTTWLFR